MDGTVDIPPPTGKDLHIYQESLRGIVDYEGFSIDVDEGVYFHHTLGAASATLNRVKGVNPSTILGKLSADGQIYLVNPNGIVFGHTAKVDTAGLIASTLDILNDDFMNGINRFTGPGGHVVNFGQLNAPGGYVALLGSEVLNTGFIQAELGSILLASGDAMTVTLDSGGHMFAVIDEATTTNLRNAAAAVTNKSLLKADGGSVMLTANILSEVFDKAINTEGIIEATDLIEDQGQIALYANKDIEVGGRISGGEVRVMSTEGHVTHLPMNEVTTMGDNFVGTAHLDYTVGNDTLIDVNEGIIDILARQNVYLGTNETQTLTQYEWEYITGDRSYQFRGHGYYTYDQNNQIVYVPISFGPDIGKDGVTPLSGALIIYEALDDPELFVSFFEPHSSIIRTCHTDPTLNADGRDHVVIDGIRYSWEDMAHLGDHDFNDAILDFSTELTTTTPGAQLTSLTDVFLTAQNGEIFQTGGNIVSNRLMMGANTGIGGTSSNGGLRATTAQLSAYNNSTGGIAVENMTDMMVTDLSSVHGLQWYAFGNDGITNTSLSSTIAQPVNLLVHGDLDIVAPIKAMGDITLTADGYIHQLENGNIVIYNPKGDLNPPSNVNSTSHDIATWTNVDTFEVEWGLPEQNEELYGHFMASAGAEYLMTEGMRIDTYGGNASIDAMDDITLTMVDAGNGNVAMTSEYGSILDGDLGVVTADYDVIGHHIDLQAPNGTVGTTETEGEIDLGYPHYEYSYVFDTNSMTIPDFIPDPYTAMFTSSGDWVFFTAIPVTHDSPNWNFHIATVAPFLRTEISMTAMSEEPYPEMEGLMSEIVHVGPYYIDMTAPIITAGTPMGIKGPDGVYRSPVSVAFDASDNMSGFPTEGDLSKDMGTKTVSGPGTGLYITSDGIFDRAGNFAEPVTVGPFAILEPDVPQTYENMIDELRVYYEILEPSQFLSVEPAQKIGLYAYHPLTETDTSAFDDLTLDVNAYEFIEEELKKKDKALLENLQ